MMHKTIYTEIIGILKSNIIGEGKGRQSGNQQVDELHKSIG